MRPYLDKSAPDVWKAVSAFSATVKQHAAAAGLSVQESEYIKLRASQLNACAYCLDVHSRESREAGIVQQKIDLLPAWALTMLGLQHGPLQRRMIRLGLQRTAPVLRWAMRDGSAHRAKRRMGIE